MSPRSRLILVWTDAELRSDSPAGAAASYLTFDRRAEERLLQAGADVHFVDDLLGWDERSRLEFAIDDALRGLATSTAAPTVDGQKLADVAGASLRTEWTLAARTLAAVRVLADGRRFDAVDSGAGCPSACVVAASCALGLGPELDRPWVPAYTAPPARHLRSVGHLNRVAAAASARATPRVLVAAGGKLTAALARSPRLSLRSRAVATLSFPGVVHGGGVRVAFGKRLPLVWVPTPDGASAGVVRATTPGPPVSTGDPALDVALQTAADAMFARVGPAASELADAATRLDDLTGLRALVLPTTESVPAQVLRHWTRSRGIACAVLQHGVYSLRHWDRRDRDADVLLAWGEGVHAQFARDAGHPAIRVVGAPDVSTSRAEPSLKLRNVLVITSNAGYGTLVGSHGSPDDFLQTVLPTLAWLTSRGVSLRVRIHPAESAVHYRRVLSEAGVAASVSQGAPPAQDVTWADAAVSTLSSFACEAASAGVPVLLWLEAPPEIRGAHFLPPFDEAAPHGTFTTSDELQGAVESLVAGGNGPVEIEELRRRLAALAAPFRPDAFVDALGSLAG